MIEGRPRRRPTTTLHALGFWIACALSGLLGIEIVDLAVGYSTEAVDGALASPRDE